MSAADKHVKQKSLRTCVSSIRGSSLIPRWTRRWKDVASAAVLAAAALDDAGHQGLHVVPLCPFIAHYIEQHAEYAGLIAPNYHTKGA
jgi:hypothetical protein